MTTTPSSVTQVALERAMKLLAASGASYAIRTPDGQMFGDLEVVVRKPKKEPKFRHVNDFTKLFPGYPEQIRAMQVGDVLRWQAADKKQAEGFRSSVASVARIAFGISSCITTVNEGHCVELLRVE